MPENLKKTQKLNDSKDQRRPRHGRRQEAQVEKKTEKKTEELKEAPKVMVPQKPPVYESPGPEFYKNLKRETDEILKITEEETAKYKKKEIQSNWSKYEMPIESYEEIEEQENMGADYEELIQAPLSVGGHFQFKHEKSWDITTGPSPYDKYFDINMDNLNLSLSTIPFYERNGVDQSIFTETDLLSMNNRATRYKQKYFNDKSYTTPEIEAQEKVLHSLKENMSKHTDIEAQEKILHNLKEDLDKNLENIETDNTMNSKMEIINIDYKDLTNECVEEKKMVEAPVDIHVELKDAPDTEINPSPIHNTETIQDTIININTVTNEPKKVDDKIVDDDEFIFAKVESISPLKETIVESKKAEAAHEVKRNPKVADIGEKETNKNPVIESPEDLEKWLDDFLDG